MHRKEILSIIIIICFQLLIMAILKLFIICTKGVKDFLYYTLDFGRGISSFLSYPIVIFLFIFISYIILIIALFIKDNYIGFRGFNLIDFLKKHPKSRKKALDLYLHSSDEYSKQIAEAYYEICNIRDKWFYGFDDKAKEKIIDLIISPEKVHEIMSTITMGIIVPDRNQLTVVQTILIMISNACWNCLNGGPYYVYRGVLDITGMEYREFFEYCIKRLAEIGFVDDSGHVWNNQDVINEYYKLEMLIKNSG